MWQAHCGEDDFILERDGGFPIYIIFCTNKVIDGTTYVNRIYAYMPIWILFFMKGNILSAVLATFILIKCVMYVGKKMDRHSLSIKAKPTSSWFE